MIFQDILLNAQLKNISSFKKSFETIINCWQRGNADKLYLMLTQTTPDDEKYKKFKNQFEHIFLVVRNEKMAEKIDGLLKTDKIYFVVVGAGHFGGDNGILKLLTQRGYKVVQQKE